MANLPDQPDSPPDAAPGPADPSPDAPASETVPGVNLPDDPEVGDAPAGEAIIPGEVNPDPEPPSVRWTPREAPPDPVPRGLLLLWVVFLCSTWMVALELDSPAPAVRWMVFGAMIGLTLLWPAYRLSLGESRRRPEATAPAGASASGAGQGAASSPAGLLRDWAVLMLVLQIAIWPLRLTAQWSIAQTIWLIAGLGAWSLLAGLIVAVGVRLAGNLARAGAMAACCLLIFGEPLVQIAVNLGRPAAAPLNWPLQVSPLGAMWRLSEPTRFWAAGPWPGVILSVAAAAVIGWMMLLIWSSRQAR